MLGVAVKYKQIKCRQGLLAEQTTSTTGLNPGPNCSV
jgi:hypothetical protein